MPSNPHMPRHHHCNEKIIIAILGGTYELFYEMLQNRLCFVLQIVLEQQKRS